ncbi:hypothetical protein BaRGS_00027934, partial [Batillaria attramentaria]
MKEPGWGKTGAGWGIGPLAMMQPKWFSPDQDPFAMMGSVSNHGVEKTPFIPFQAPFNPFQAPFNPSQAVSDHYVAGLASLLGLSFVFVFIPSFQILSLFLELSGTIGDGGIGRNLLQSITAGNFSGLADLFNAMYTQGVSQSQGRRLVADPPSNLNTATSSRIGYEDGNSKYSKSTLTDRKCNALGELIRNFAFTFVENVAQPVQGDGFCVVDVPDIRVRCSQADGDNPGPPPTFGTQPFPPPFLGGDDPISGLPFPPIPPPQGGGAAFPNPPQPQPPQAGFPAAPTIPTVAPPTTATGKASTSVIPNISNNSAAYRQ